MIDINAKVVFVKRLCPAAFTPNLSPCAGFAYVKGLAQSGPGGGVTHQELEDAINAESEIREAADSSLFDNFATSLDLISAETAARELADNNLSDAINGKISSTDIANNLTTNNAAKVLSAAQGVVLKGITDTLSTNLSNHTGNTSNPHSTTLEQVRSAGNSLLGDINVNNNRLRNIPAAVASDEPINKQQFDSYNNSVGKNRGPIDCSGNPNYPASNQSDRWEVTVAGKIGGASGIDVEIYDEIVCVTASAGGDQATAGSSFYVVQGNVGRATETNSGFIALATDAEVQAGTDNTKSVTSLKLANWWTNIKTLAQIFSEKITFDHAPRFKSVDGGHILMTDASKDLTSVHPGTAFNKDFGTTSGTVLEGSTQAQIDTNTNNIATNTANITANTAAIAANSTAIAGKEPAITATNSTQYWRGDKTFQTLNKAAVGLGNVDNTADASKPISTATQAALDAKLNASDTSVTNSRNRRLVASSYTQQQVTNSAGVEQLIASITIDAGIAPVGSSIEVWTFWSSSANNGSKLQKVYLNSANNLTGATLYGSFSYNNAGGVDTNTKILMTGASSQKGRGLGTSVYGYGLASGTGVITSAYTTASAKYIHITGTRNSASDNLYLEAYEIYINQ